MARGHLEVVLQTALPEGRVASKPWACCFVRRIPGASLDRGGSFWTSRCKRRRGLLRHSVSEESEEGFRSVLCIYK